MGKEVLITGRTTHDTLKANIDAIMATWGNGDAYTKRVNQLSTTGSTTGAFKLSASTVTDDGLLETIAADTNALIDDWFLLEVGQDVANADAGELITDLS